MNRNEIIGGRINTLRESFGLNQAQTAKFLGIDQSYISKCEKGERQFSMDLLEKLCDLFGCRINDLLTEGKEISTLHFSFRANAIKEEDLIAIA